MQQIEQLALRASIDLGIRSIQLIDSQVGQYIIGAAQQEVDSLAEDLINAPLDKVQEIQLEIKARKLALGWIYELIRTGIDAAVLNEETKDE